MQLGFIFFDSRKSTYGFVKAVVGIIIIYLRRFSDNNRFDFCPESASALFLTAQSESIIQKTWALL
jgi:hypothetical protein